MEMVMDVGAQQQPEQQQSQAATQAGDETAMRLPAQETSMSLHAEETSMIERLEAAVKALEAQVTRLDHKASPMSAGPMAAATAADVPVPVTVTYAPGRKTVAMLSAKAAPDDAHAGLGMLDAALVSLPVEQRIAIKAHLLRAGLLG